MVFTESDNSYIFDLVILDGCEYVSFIYYPTFSDLEYEVGDS
jgi:hypothetical protein